MSNTFRKQELHLAIDAAKIALANAATSLAKMLKEDVLLKNFSIQLSQAPIFKGKQDLFLLETLIVGEISAHTFLVFNEKDAEKICHIMLPASLFNEQEMKDGVLTELDNILVASLVTKYADIFKKELNGHLPKISKLAANEVEKLIEKTIYDSDDFSFQSNFISKQSQIEGIFVCVFTANFNETMTDQANNLQTQEEINSQKTGFAKILDNLQDLIKNIFD